jgi:hypothetical protein
MSNPLASHLVHLPLVDDKYRPMWTPGTLVRCTKDSPPYVGFGRDLRAGDIVAVKGVCWDGTHYQISVPEECGSYRMEGYFEVCLD